MKMKLRFKEILAVHIPSSINDLCLYCTRGSNIVLLLNTQIFVSQHIWEKVVTFKSIFHTHRAIGKLTVDIERKFRANPKEHICTYTTTNALPGLQTLSLVALITPNTRCTFLFHSLTTNNFKYCIQTKGILSRFLMMSSFQRCFFLKTYNYFIDSLLPHNCQLCMNTLPSVSTEFGRILV